MQCVKCNKPLADFDEGCGHDQIHPGPTCVECCDAELIALADEGENEIPF